MGAINKVAPNGRSKSHMSYYVAMGVIIGLLVLLCCYACYFFINKIKELSGSDSPSTTTPATSCPKKEPVSYPVQPVVRESATAMAALCRQLPAPCVLQGGDQVHPGARSPAPRRTTSPGDPEATAPADPPPDKVPAPAAAVPCITLEAAS